MSIYVKFAAVNGSIGTAEECAGRIYVTWNYGKAVDGSAITAIGGYADYSELAQIPSEMFHAYTAMPAWSDEQRSVRALIDDWLATQIKKPFGADGCVCPCPPCFCKASEK